MGPVGHHHGMELERRQSTYIYIKKKAEVSELCMFSYVINQKYRLISSRIRIPKGFPLPLFFLCFVFVLANHWTVFWAYNECTRSVFPNNFWSFYVMQIAIQEIQFRPADTNRVKPIIMTALWIYWGNKHLRKAVLTISSLRWLNICT